MHKVSLSLCLYLIAIILMPVGVLAEDNASQPVPVKYYRLYPDLVTNLKSGSKPHYIKVRIEVMARGEGSDELVKYHEPLIRDSIITLINSKSKSQMRSFKGQKKTRSEVLAAIRKLMQEEEGSPIVEQVLFTNVVIE